MRDLATIVKEIQDLIAKAGGVAAPGTAFFDLVVAPASTIAYSLESAVEALRNIWELDPSKFTDEQADALAALFGITRVPAQAARTTVTFYRYTAPEEGFTIPAGTQVATPPPMITFATQRELKTVDFRLNSDTGLYEASVEAVCTTVGEIGNVGAYEIDRTVVSIPDVGVVNRVAAFGGTETESTASLLLRLKSFLREKFGTLEYVIRKILDEVHFSDIKYVSGDGLVREDTLGAIDIYALGENRVAYSQEVKQSGNAVTVELMKAPAFVRSVRDVSVSDGNVSVSGVEFPAVDLEGSIRGKTKITLSFGGGAPSTVTISYFYDKNIEDAQEVVDSLKQLGYDILVRRALPVRINVKLQVDTSVATEPEREVLRGAISRAVSDTLVVGKLGGTFWFSDIIAAVEAVPGVLGVAIEDLSAEPLEEAARVPRPFDVVDTDRKKIVLCDREYIREVSVNVTWIS